MDAVQLFVAKRSRAPLSVEKKKCIVQYKLDHPNSTQNDIRNHFIALWGARIGRSTISEVLKSKEKWLQVTARGNCLSLRGCREPKLESALYEWICEKRDQIGHVTSEMIISQAKMLGERMGVENFSYSKGWMERFKKRFDIKLNRTTLAIGCNAVGEPKPKKPKVDVSLARDELNIAVGQYACKDIFSMDEIALYYRLKPQSMLVDSCDLKSEERITLALCSNSTGTEKLKPVVITKDAKPTCFMDGFDPRTYVDYNHNPKALMTPSLFCTWIKDFDDSMVKARRKVLLLLTYNHCHRLPEGLQNVQVKFLTAENKDQLHPNICGISKSFKFHYRRILARHLIDTTDPSINLHQSLSMIKDAWSLVESHIVMNCWYHTGIIVRDSPSLLWCTGGILSQMEDEPGEMEEDVSKLVSHYPFTRQLVQKWIAVDDHVETCYDFTVKAEVYDVDSKPHIEKSDVKRTSIQILTNPTTVESGKRKVAAEEDKPPERVTPEQFQAAISTAVTYLEQNSFLPGVTYQLDSILNVKDFMASHLRDGDDNNSS